MQFSFAPANAENVLNSHLQNLQSEFQQFTVAQPATAFVSRNAAINVVQNTNVVVDISVKNQAEVQPLIVKLRTLGATHTSNYKKQVSAIIPIIQLPQLNNYSEISWVRSQKATRRELGSPGGSVFNAADPALFTDVVRKRYNVDGSGVTIGVMSDSFNCLGGAELDIATGDLPGNINVLKEFPFCEAGTDEGRAMMQLIHDIAPGAKQLFYTGFVSATDFAAGIQALADAGADIIVDDIGYFNMPMYQEGPIAQSVTEVKARGVSYFSAAGNNARLSYENNYFAGIESLSQDNAHDFGRAAGEASDFYQKITLPAEQNILIVLQWDDPAEVAGGQGAATDLDIFLLDSSKQRILTSSQDNNIGHNPVEIISGLHTSEITGFYLYISHRAGPAPSRIKYLINGPVAPWPVEGEELEDEFIAVSIDQYATHSSTIFGHPNSAGAIAVGAIPYQQTPWFNTLIGESRIESFSSAGGTPIFFNPDGSRMQQQEIRFRPQIVAPDNSDTTFFGIDTDNNGLPNFSGTSAAAPHAAALAALLKQAFPYLSPDGISNTLMKGSRNLNDPAQVNKTSPANFACVESSFFDWGTGCGLVQADLAFEQADENTDEIFLTLNTFPTAITADSDFEYQLKVHNFSASVLENVRIRALQLPDLLRFIRIEGCVEIDPFEVSCRLGNIPAGETRDIVIQVMPINGADGVYVFEADLLSDSPVDLADSKISLETPTSVSRIPGDFNKDGCVDTSDWGIMFAAMRTGGSFDAFMDLTGDGIIGLEDLTALEAFYSRPLGEPCR